MPEASFTIYVITVTPTLKVNVPILLIPVSGEEATVAPVIVQVSVFTAQLSPVVEFGVITEVVHTPAAAFCEMFAGQLIVGGWISEMVTVKLRDVVFPEASVAVYVMVVIPELKI